MKIHRLGNDYAFQRKQKSLEKSKAGMNKKTYQSVTPSVEQENVEDKVSGFGEGNLGTEVQGEEPKQEKEVRKKKKEAGPKAQQLQNDSEI